MSTPVLGQQHLGEVIRLLRKRTPLTLEQLASRIGVSPASVSGYERDVVVPGLMVVRRILSTLAQELNVDADALWEEVGERLTDFVSRDDLGKRLAQWGVPVIENRLLLEAVSRMLDLDPHDVWRAYGRALDEIDR